MKVRLIGTEKELQTVLRQLEKHRGRFTSWRKPQKGGNPKYSESLNLLCYLEIEAADLAGIIKRKPNQP